MCCLCESQVMRNQLRFQQHSFGQIESVEVLLPVHGQIDVRKQTWQVLRLAEALHRLPCSSAEPGYHCEYRFGCQLGAQLRLPGLWCACQLPDMQLPAPIHLE